MKHEGVVFDLYHEKGKPMWEGPLPCATAFLTPNKLSLEYFDGDGTRIGVVATSIDGVVYSGHWGYPLLDSLQPVELKLFKSENDSEVLLFGTWVNRGISENYKEGLFMFRLKPEG
jgi:hypothetical protein